MQVLALHMAECQHLLKQALEIASATTTTTTRNKSRYAHSSSEEEDREESDDSSSSSEEEKEEEVGDSTKLDNPPLLLAEKLSAPERPQQSKIKKKRTTKVEMTQRQREQAIQKHFASLTCEYLPLGNGQQLKVPAVLFHKDDDQERSCILQSSSPQQQPVVVVLALRSGRFAGAVFQGDTCVVHTTRQRYTVRRGQGKAQSSQDNAGAAPKSMGAQLRRRGELQLQKDIADTIHEWKDYIQTAALIFVACPKTMRRQLMVESLRADDRRIRRVPLDMGRPSFEAVSLIHAILTRVVVEDVPSLPENENDVSPDAAEEEDSDQVHTSDGQLVDKRNIPDSRSPEPEPIVELAPLHKAARDGNLELLQELLKADDSHDVNEVAGEDSMTPLHYAAQSDALTASACVTMLLEQGRANPCRLDQRNRVPYYLSSHEKVRDAFRICRASLGEDYCSWDAGAKVGPPLTDDDLQARKEKEAEKRRRKKSRQKEKQAKEKAQEQVRNEEEARQKAEEEAKRVRDGLAPKPGGGNVCDFCQTVCRRKNQMFQRLTYSYCSTDCVNKHKRELMASAALARFG